ncbi:MAG: hypothetical protein J5I53_00765 [Bradyrhizobiaceae bacterium]|nr:hypothetical protein [Bradyrhizobiaceae bacterium]
MHGESTYRKNHTALLMVIAGIMACCALSSTTLSAQTVRTKADNAYVENKGQIGDQAGKPNHNVRFMISRSGLNIQLLTQGFSYDSYSIDRCDTDHATRYENITVQNNKRHVPPDELTPDASILFHRVDVSYEGSNSQPRITATGASADYLNYYTHITEQTCGHDGVTFVRGYNRVTYHDVWPGIDVEWFQDNSGQPEYQFIVHPGADLSQIRLRYTGAASTLLADGTLELNIVHGAIHELVPLSYCVESGRTVTARFTRLDEDLYGFEIPTADFATDGETLVIDPTPRLLWATYYGGTDDDRAEDVTASETNSIVIAGFTPSTSAIATQGAHQTTLDAGADAFFASFDSTGARKWGTYYGGEAEDQANAVTMVDANTILGGGWTESQAGIATPGSFQEHFGGVEQDGFIVAFDAGGLRRWSTYYGGEGWDYIGDIAGNANTQIAVVGGTSSVNGIASSRSHQESLSGDYDAFVATFNLSGERLWASYFGGEADESGIGVAIFDDGGLAITGKTNSTTGIATIGSYQDTLLSTGGVWYSGNAFVASFSASGSLAWSTYYGGSGYEWVDDIAVSSDGDIVIVGETSSEDHIATPGAHQEVYGGGQQDAFIANFDSMGNLVWATYYGGSEYELWPRIEIAHDGSIVVVGYTGSVQNIATTGSYQETLLIDRDNFLAMFTSSGQRVWGSYTRLMIPRFTGISMCPGDKIALAGFDFFGGFATEDAHQQNFGGGVMDGFLAVFDLRDFADTSVSVSEHTITEFSGARFIAGRLEVRLTESVEVSASLITTDGRIFPVLYPTIGSVGVNGYDLTGVLQQVPPGAYLLKVSMGETSTTLKVMH